MKFFYLRTLFVILCVWFMTGTAVQAQPDGNYGPGNAKYAVPSGAYFVSPTGKGGTPCSQSNPCSLSKALSSAPSGTTIVLRKGTYRTSGFDGKIPRKLTLQPYPGEEVILKGSNVANNWSADGSVWQTAVQAVFPPKYTAENKSKVVTSENLMADHRDMVFVNGSPLKQVASKSNVKSGTFYVDYGRKTIYIGTNPDGKQVEIAASTWGLHTYNVSASGITVRGLKFMHYAETGIMLTSPDAVIEDNEFTHNAIAGIKIYNAKRAKVRNNRFSENGLHGAGINGSDYLLFENNIVANNNSEKFNRNSWSAAGAKILLSPNSMIRNNLFNNNDANGVWLDHETNHTAIVNNMATNNTRMGIHCEISQDVIIAGNVVTGSGYNAQNLPGAGVMVANSSDVRVYNNTLVKNYINIQIADAERGPNYITRNTIVKNNILSNATVSEYPSSQIWVRFLKCGDAVVKEMDYNGYHKSSANQPDLLIRWKIANNTCGAAEKLSTLAEIRSALGFDKNSMAITSSEDPYFIDPSSGNLNLKSNSSALKAGEALPADIQDALGWSTSGNVDLGAFQSGDATTPSTPSTPTSTLPWKESFDLANGTTVDNGTNGSTAWSLEKKNLGSNAIFEVRNTKLTARGTVNEGIWRSELIKLNGNTVNCTAVLSSLGNLEAGYDYMRVYYKLDNGSEKLAGEAKGNISGTKTVTITGVKGSTIQLVVRIKNSDLTEHYFLDDVKVELAGTTAPSSPTPPSTEGLPWVENFNATSFKGSLETSKMYANAIFKVKDGKLMARGVGDVAWKSEVISLNGNTVNCTAVLSSLGNLEAGYDYMRVYYKLDNGSEKLAGEAKGNISGTKTVTITGVKGSTIQLVVRIKNSDLTEHYFLDDVKVELAGTTARYANKVKAEKENAGVQQNVEDVKEVMSSETEMSVYPNPVESFLEVRVSSVEIHNTTIVLLDMNGSKVYEYQIDTNEAFNLDFSNLISGIYFLQTIDEEGNIQTKRIIKQ